MTTDITYAQVDSWFGHCRRDLKLDLIYPEDGEGKAYPCIVWICGGAWQRMDKAAHLACMAALNRDKKLDTGEYLEYSSQVQAACPWYPPTDASHFPYNDVEKAAMSSESLLMGFNVMTHPQEAYENSPVSKVTPDAPPFLLIHGTKDSTVPFSQSEELYDALEAAGCDVTLLALDGAEHADLMFFQDEVWQQIIAFFKRTL